MFDEEFKSLPIHERIKVSLEYEHRSYEYQQWIDQQIDEKHVREFYQMAERDRVIPLDSIDNTYLEEDEWENLLEVAATKPFEEWLQHIPDVYSSEDHMPLDDLYAEYIYQRNYSEERLRWQDLLRKEVF